MGCLQCSVSLLLLQTFPQLLVAPQTSLRHHDEPLPSAAHPHRCLQLNHLRFLLEQTVQVMGKKQKGLSRPESSQIHGAFLDRTTRGPRNADNLCTFYTVSSLESLFLLSTHHFWVDLI